ncbi:MAG: Nramp family divalent metal transporter [Marinoscillum sp.]
MVKSKAKRFGGPGLLIAAAFIGPGTVTVCSLAGANHQFDLLWVMVISVVVTIFLQEMASRLGIVTRLDLASLIRREVGKPILRILVIGLVFCSIVIGNAAYEAGNISGAILGLDTFGNIPYATVILGIIAGLLLWSGSYKIIERVLIGLVGLMSVSFVVTAILTRPDIGALFKGLVPSFDTNSLIILGLVGTTIVPYNLFLHAALAKTQWSDSEVKDSRNDTIRSISIGGLVSVCIIISAAGISSGTSITSAIDLAESLEPVYGPAAKYLLSLGLFSAGITSAVTAPLAAAFVAQGCFNWKSSLTSWRFRLVWMSILIIGVVFSSIGFKPIEIIKFAQVTNGLLLPIIAGLLLWLCSRPGMLGVHRNHPYQTLLGLLIVIVALLLGIKSIWSIF